MPRTTSAWLRPWRSRPPKAYDRRTRSVLGVRGRNARSRRAWGHDGHRSGGGPRGSRGLVVTAESEPNLRFMCSTWVGFIVGVLVQDLGQVIFRVRTKWVEVPDVFRPRGSSSRMVQHSAILGRRLVGGAADGGP